ncbi:hypothetical protein ACM6Q7_04825 [Peribacillus butanolivorans]|uniref:hypothetical protein n=1 Tax=Peribacillus butanolivorans TaxID=421767 RepID=UPI0039FBBFC3
MIDLIVLTDSIDLIVLTDSIDLIVVTDSIDSIVVTDSIVEEGVFGNLTLNSNYKLWLS